MEKGKIQLNQIPQSALLDLARELLAAIEHSEEQQQKSA